MDGERRVLFLVGPTASGKTAASLRLAGQARVEIVNADSRQVYRGISIGVAKPTPAELALAPHHVVDVADPDEPFSLATFLALARAAVDDVLARGAAPVVVGGAGQYVWGLAEGWRPPAAPPDRALREELEKTARREGAAALHERLRAVDPAAADSIDPRNVRRVARAIEVWRTTGAPFSRQRRKEPPGFVPVIVGVRRPREELHARIDARVDAMMAAGWLDEVRGLLAAGYGPELPSFSSHGYRELAAHLAGEITLDEALARARSGARRFVRAQGGWFKAADPRISWADGEDAAVERALSLLRA